jgi:lipid A 3-O-deacylase
LVVRKIWLGILLLGAMPLVAQRITPLAFQFSEENDFLNLTQRGLDRYYTQGLRFEFVYKAAKPVALEKLMVRTSSTSLNQFSWLLTQQMYTPRKTLSLDFVGDRPYAGVLYVTQQLISYDSVKRLRLATRLDAGIIGPASLGESTQNLFHKIINNQQAVGWYTQMRNDVVLNYSLSAEKEILRAKLFRIEAKGAAHAGTLLVQAVGGINLLLGNYQQDKNFRWELFFKPEVRAVAFNALLQGGVFNQLNADAQYAQYFLPSIKTLVYSHNTGFTIRYRRVELTYQQINLTREFSVQLPHYYGSVTGTIWFKKK